MEVPDVDIIGAIRRGDLATLRRWAQKGFHIMSECVVNELGADVNQGDENGLRP